MMRPNVAAAALLCLLTTACLPEEDPTAKAAPVAAEPAPAPQDARAKQREIQAAAEQAVVGTRVHALGDQWLQGQADVGGTQLVVFFELWCPHCRREVPRLQALHQDLDGLEVVGLTRLSRGVTEEQLMGFVDEQGLSYAVGRPPEGLAQKLAIRGIPAAVVLKDGEVVWRGHPARLDDETLKSWL